MWHWSVRVGSWLSEEVSGSSRVHTEICIPHSSSVSGAVSVKAKSLSWAQDRRGERGGGWEAMEKTNDLDRSKMDFPAFVTIVAKRVSQQLQYRYISEAL
uniref:Uncharacterized protein n=1 Tax=Knipowitschia caucasica TaxID=637954 RepID=A0AAV2IU74_KNICA